MLELLDSLVRKAYQFQPLAVFSKPTHEVSHLLSEFGVVSSLDQLAIDENHPADRCHFVSFLLDY